MTMHEMDRVRLYRGCCLDGMEAMRLAGETVHSVVTDPPYGIDFMGRAWDGAVPGVPFWKAAMALLPPGGHLLAFGGSRTFHRMAVAIEDAGFELRDTIMWLYGTGFPKSHDVSKGIDKVLGAMRDKVAPRSVIGHQRNVGNVRPYMLDPNHMTDSDEPASPEAAQWQGWGTALKPAFEPIIVARKPLSGTVAQNVLAHGTGALNIDACRIAAAAGEGPVKWNTPRGGIWKTDAEAKSALVENTAGRWPANVIHDGSDEVEAAFATYGERGAAAPVRGTEASEASSGRVTGKRARVPGAFHADTGSAARFFYSAKAGKRDRADSRHPTIKPLALMRYLVRLVTPPGGTVLDPFGGSGTTAAAAYMEGLNAVTCEISAEYQDDIVRRINALIMEDLGL